MKDYLSFIKENPRYQNAVDKSFNPDEYFSEIQKAGYATDPNYADKLKKFHAKLHLWHTNSIQIYEEEKRQKIAINGE